MHRKLGHPHYIFTVWHVCELFLQRNQEQFPTRSSVYVNGRIPAENIAANLPVEVDGTTDGVASYNQCPLAPAQSPKREDSGISLATSDQTDEGVRAHSFSYDIR